MTKEELFDEDDNDEEELDDFVENQIDKDDE